MTDSELIELIETQCHVMIEISTGGYDRIQAEDPEYRSRRALIRVGLEERGLVDPNPHANLRRWYAKWSSDLPTYASRRNYVGDLYDPVLEVLRSPNGLRGSALFEEPSGWGEVDRVVENIRVSLRTASTPESFQSIGLLCREALISLAQGVYDPATHGTLNGVDASSTDAKRMLEAYISYELGGGSNEEARRYARAAITLADSLVHRRTASYRDAALCSQVLISVVSLVAILAGIRGAAHYLDGSLNTGD